MITASLAALAIITSAHTPAARYRHPSECQDGCMVVTAYRDEGGYTDWACGDHTYGGHGGTDFGIYGGFGAVDEGRAVVAAAPGVVVQANDGEFDRCTSGDCAGGGGFGNYVAIEHDDGVVTFYGHMRAFSVGVGVGDNVSCGQYLGFIASSGYSTGPHLHFEPRAPSSIDPFAGPCSGFGGSWVDQRGYNELPAQSCEGPPNAAPYGYVDSATCDGVVGWAQDPDAVDAAIAVHIYVDGEAGSGARGFPIVAGNYRDDLCAAIGSCAHGFGFGIPPYLRDGNAHSAFVYAIDTAGGNNPQLVGSGAQFSCAPPALTALVAAAEGMHAVLRHVASPDVMTAWALPFDDVLPVASLDGAEVGAQWADAPRLVQQDGDPAVYVIDRDGTKRHVTSPESLGAWRFALEALEHVDVSQFPTGAALPFGPQLVRMSTDSAVYVVDFSANAPGGEGEGEGEAGEGEGEGAEGEGEEGEGEEGEGEEGEGEEGEGEGEAHPSYPASTAGSCASSSGGLAVALLALVIRRRAHS